MILAPPRARGANWPGEVDPKNWTADIAHIRLSRKGKIMLGKKKKVYSAAFKAQVALAAFKGDKTLNELARLHRLHSSLIRGWKKQLLENAEDLFLSPGKSAETDHEILQATLYEQIGKLQVELDWLKKKGATFH